MSTLLERVQSWDPHEIAARPAVQQLWDKGLLWSLAHRRSFKYPMGVSIPKDAFFDYEPREMVPISDEEIAIMCWCAAGSNGIIRNDLSFKQGAVIHPWFEGRVFPSACNVWTTHLVFFNDEGTYRYIPHVPTQPVEIETKDDIWKIFQAFKDGLVQINDQPLRIKEESPLAWKLNTPFILKPGTVVFLPVTDLTFEFLNLLFHIYDQEKSIVVDDLGGGMEIAGVEKWVKDGTLNGLHTPLSYVETQVPAVVYSAGAFMIQNLCLAQAALGLGGYPLGGYTTLILFGGTPFLKGLGFQYASDKKGFPYPVGIPGHFHGHLPPFMTIEEAVRDLYEVRFKDDYGRYSPTVKEGQKVMYKGIFPEEREVHRPFKEELEYVQKVMPYSEKTVEIVTATADYLYKKYGRLPALGDPFIAPTMVNISHVDVKFYEKYAKEGSTWQDHYDHFKIWHNGYEPK